MRWEKVEREGGEMRKNEGKWERGKKRDMEEIEKVRKLSELRGRREPRGSEGAKRKEGA